MEHKNKKLLQTVIEGKEAMGDIILADQVAQYREFLQEVINNANRANKTLFDLMQHKDTHVRMLAAQAAASVAYNMGK